eukprot:tig00020693_g13027.t1
MSTSTTRISQIKLASPPQTNLGTLRCGSVIVPVTLISPASGSLQLNGRAYEALSFLNNIKAGTTIAGLSATSVMQIASGSAEASVDASGKLTFVAASTTVMGTGTGTGSTTPAPSPSPSSDSTVIIAAVVGGVGGALLLGGLLAFYFAYWRRRSRASPRAVAPDPLLKPVAAADPEAVKVEPAAAKVETAKAEPGKVADPGPANIKVDVDGGGGSAPVSHGVVRRTDTVSSMEDGAFSDKTKLPSADKEWDAFVSYSHRDSERVFAYVDILAKKGLKIWRAPAIDRELATQTGSRWMEVIGQAMEASEVFICFMSRNYFASQNCDDELQYAHHILRISKFPVFIEDPATVDLRTDHKARASVNWTVQPKGTREAITESCEKLSVALAGQIKANREKRAREAAAAALSPTQNAPPRVMPPHGAAMTELDASRAHDPAPAPAGVVGPDLRPRDAHSGWADRIEQDEEAVSLGTARTPAPRAPAAVGPDSDLHRRDAREGWADRILQDEEAVPLVEPDI